MTSEAADINAAQAVFSNVLKMLKEKYQKCETRSRWHKLYVDAVGQITGYSYDPNNLRVKDLVYHRLFDENYIRLGDQSDEIIYTGKDA
ncbi:MAG: hypothetical protein WA667_26280 [Candidatus Nitrosopolaris sp.]